MEPNDEPTRFRTWLPSLLGSAFILLLLAACSSRSKDGIDLSETHTVRDLGFSIDYPTGWHAGTRETVTNISELEVDHKQNFGGHVPPQGPVIIIDHRDLQFMEEELGLPSDASIQDLLEFNIAYFGMPEPEVSETEIFGNRALCASSEKALEWVMKCGGFISDEVFLVSVKAPTEQEFTQLLAIWEQMRMGIRPVPAEE